MVPEDLADFNAAAAAFLATYEQVELYQGKPAPEHVQRHLNEVYTRLISVLESLRKICPGIRAFEFRDHVILPWIEAGKIKAVLAIPNGNILDVDAVLAGEDEDDDDEDEDWKEQR